MFGRRKHERLQQSLVRAIKERDDAYENIRAMHAESVELRERLQDARNEARDEREHYESFLALVSASLSEVAAYEGMPIGGAESIVLYLNELVRDHEELERRIDLAIMECRAEDVVKSAYLALILRGSVKTPDQAEG